MAKKIDYKRQIWEGWTVQDFINDLNVPITMIMTDQSWQKPFKNREELKKWCMDHQPYYKKYIPGVVDHFCQQYNIAA